MPVQTSIMASGMLQSTQRYFLRQDNHMPDWKAWTVEEAAEKTGYNAEYIRRLCRQKNSPIEHTRIGRVLLINADSMLAYVEKMQSKDDGRYGPKEK